MNDPTLRLFAIILLVAAITAAVVWLLARFRRYPWIKYLPPAALLVLSVYFILEAQNANMGLADLGLVVLFLIAGISGLIGILAAAVVDIIRKVRKK